MTSTLVNREGYITIPRIVGLLSQCDRSLAHLHIDGVGIEKVDVKGIILNRIDVLRQRGNETSCIGRTAGTTKPLLTLVLSHAL